MDGMKPFFSLISSTKISSIRDSILQKINKNSALTNTLNALEQAPVAEAITAANNLASNSGHAAIPSVASHAVDAVSKENGCVSEQRSEEPATTSEALVLKDVVTREQMHSSEHEGTSGKLCEHDPRDGMTDPSCKALHNSDEDVNMLCYLESFENGLHHQNLKTASADLNIELTNSYLDENTSLNEDKELQQRPSENDIEMTVVSVKQERFSPVITQMLSSDSESDSEEYDLAQCSYTYSYRHIKVIAMESESDSDSSSSSFEFEPRWQAPQKTSYKPDDLLPLKELEYPIGNEKECELPPIEDLKITIHDETSLVEIGEVTGIVDKLVVVESSVDFDDYKPVHEETVFFFQDRKPIGKVHEVFGNTHKPAYSVRFNSKDEIISKGVEIGTKVFFAPRPSQQDTELTHYIFNVAALEKEKGYDLPRIRAKDISSTESLEGSDEEQEARDGLKTKPNVGKSRDPTEEGVLLNRRKNKNRQKGEQGDNPTEVGVGKEKRKKFKKRHNKNLNSSESQTGGQCNEQQQGTVLSCGKLSTPVGKASQNGTSEPCRPAQSRWFSPPPPMSPTSPLGPPQSTFQGGPQFSQKSYGTAWPEPVRHMENQNWQGPNRPVASQGWQNKDNISWNSQGPWQGFGCYNNQKSQSAPRGPTWGQPGPWACQYSSPPPALNSGFRPAGVCSFPRPSVSMPPSIPPPSPFPSPVPPGCPSGFVPSSGFVPPGFVPPSGFVPPPPSPSTATPLSSPSTASPGGAGCFPAPPPFPCPPPMWNSHPPGNTWLASTPPPPPQGPAR